MVVLAVFVIGLFWLDMNADKKLIQQLVSEYTGDDLAGYLAEQLSYISKTKSSIASINKKIDEARKQYEQKKLDLNQELRETQKKCRHLSRTYHGDPSGNNDSFYECDHCGKEL